MYPMKRGRGRSRIAANGCVAISSLVVWCTCGKLSELIGMSPQVLLELLYAVSSQLTSWSVQVLVGAVAFTQLQSQGGKWHSLHPPPPKNIPKPKPKTTTPENLLNSGAKEKRGWRDPELCENSVSSQTLHWSAPELRDPGNYQTPLGAALTCWWA